VHQIFSLSLSPRHWSNNQDILFSTAQPLSDTTANLSSLHKDLGRKKAQTQASDLAKLVMSSNLPPTSSNASSTASSPKISADGENASYSIKHADGLLPPPALGNGSLATALNSLGEIIKRDRIAFDSPFALSNASTAPGSPRM
jgi:6-phosphofructo-2-kinase